MLPPDDHVHSEFSWDTVAASMEGACARAVVLGLPAITFTEHVDPTPCAVHSELLPHLPERFARHLTPEGVLIPPPLDLEGYLAAIARCRDRFPSLTIRAGVEMGEPHLWPEQTAALARHPELSLMLGSLHAVREGEAFVFIDHLYERLPPAEVVRIYLAEALVMVSVAALPFASLAHIDYPLRHWPATEEAFNPEAFKDEFRAVLRELARSGRALEINTRLPLDRRILRWWRECGGTRVTFGSDAHVPENVGARFAEAAALAAAEGFAR